MPQNKYSYQLKNGGTLDLEGAEPPTDEEVEALARENKVELLPMQTTSAPILNDTNVPMETTPRKQANIPAPPSRTEKLYRMMFDAPEFITKGAKRFSDYVTTPELDDSSITAGAKGFLGGAIEGLGSLLSPANIIQTALPASRVANVGLGLAQGAHGVHELSEGNIAEGIGDMGMGLLGMAPHMELPEMKPSPYRPLPPDNMNQEAIKSAIEAPIVDHLRPSGKWDENIDVQAKPAVLDDNALFDLARGKQKMGLDMPSDVAPDMSHQLPRDLRGAKPRYNMGMNSYEPNFESDLDKALFIIAQKNPSKRDADYLKFVMDATGLDEAAVRAAGANIRTQLKTQLSGQEPGSVNIKSIFQPPTKKPTAEFLGMQPLADGGETPLFNIIGGPKDRSTVTLETLNDLGIEMPEIPTQQPKLNGDQIRALAIKKSQERMDAKNKGFKGVVPDEPVGGGIDNIPPDVPTGGGNGGPIDPKIEPIVRKLRENDPPASNAFEEAWNLTKGTMAVDLPFITSAAFRQALPMAGTPAWFKAWIPSVRAFGSKAFSKAHEASMQAHPLMQRKTIPIIDPLTGQQMIRKGRPVLKETPSIIEQMGVEFADLNSLKGREETIRSGLAEKIPVWGKYVAASNRGYTAYLNDLRLGAANNFYEAMPDKNNMVALKELGEAVNVFTGRGSLTATLPSEIGLPGGGNGLSLKNVLGYGGFAGKEAGLEKYARALSNALWAPKLIASRMKMLNPVNYVTGTPQARKEYLKAALRTAGAWTTFAGVASQIPGVQVNLNDTSADFGKIKIGNLRLDPGGGFQQFLVLAARLARQESTSTSKNSYGKVTPFGGRNPNAGTTGKTLQDFFSNKLHPRMKQFYDAAFARTDRPYHVIDRELQQWIPMMTGDLVEVAKENPELAAGLAPLISAGMGMQNYEGGDFNKPVVTPMLPDVVGENEITLGR